MYKLTFALAPKVGSHRGSRECPRDLRLLVIHAFCSTCQYCNKSGDETLGPDNRRWHVDRVIPGSKGGEYTPDNVTLACATCNVRKKDKTVEIIPFVLSQREGAISGTRYNSPTKSAGGATDGKEGCHRVQNVVPLMAPNPSEIRHLTEEKEAFKKAMEEAERKGFRNPEAGESVEAYRMAILRWNMRH
jgi:hypothetical protein